MLAKHGTVGERLDYLEQKLGDSAAQHASALRALKDSHEKHQAEMAGMLKASDFHASLPERIARAYPGASAPSSVTRSRRRGEGGGRVGGARLQRRGEAAWRRRRGACGAREARRGGVGGRGGAAARVGRGGGEVAEAVKAAWRRRSRPRRGGGGGQGGMAEVVEAAWRTRSRRHGGEGGARRWRRGGGGHRGGVAEPAEVGRGGRGGAGGARLRRRSRRRRRGRGAGGACPRLRAAGGRAVAGAPRRHRRRRCASDGGGNGGGGVSRPPLGSLPVLPTPSRWCRRRLGPTARHLCRRCHLRPIRLVCRIPPPLLLWRGKVASGPRSSPTTRGGMWIPSSWPLWQPPSQKVVMGGRLLKSSARPVAFWLHEWPERARARSWAHVVLAVGCVAHARACARSRTERGYASLAQAPDRISGRVLMRSARPNGKCVCVCAGGSDLGEIVRLVLRKL